MYYCHIIKDSICASNPLKITQKSPLPLKFLNSQIYLKITENLRISIREDPLIKDTMNSPQYLTNSLLERT
jgi:hypothetical protein